jgi:hypothetical protein
MRWYIHLEVSILLWWVQRGFFLFLVYRAPASSCVNLFVRIPVISSPWSFDLPAVNQPDSLDSLTSSIFDKILNLWNKLFIKEKRVNKSRDTIHLRPLEAHSNCTLSNYATLIPWKAQATFHLRPILKGWYLSYSFNLPASEIFTILKYFIKMISKLAVNKIIM